MKYTELLKMEEMSFEEKVMDLFMRFPFNQSYSEELYKSIQSNHKRGIQITSFHMNIYWVEIYVENLGTFKKHYDRDSDKGVNNLYRISFAEKDDHGTGTMSDPFLKDDVDRVCKNSLPFMLSQGNDKRLIPLLINDFPFFARYALEYQP